MVLNYKTTKDIAVKPNIIDQVIGQDSAVEVIRKAANQRRHVLLIGEPGVGKSMMGVGLAELLPKEKLKDILSFANPNDENQPLIRSVPAGQGRDLVVKARIETAGQFKNQSVIIFVLVLLSMIAPWWVFSYYGEKYGVTVGAIMFGSFFLGGMLFLAAFIIFLNLGKRMGEKARPPKIIVDNFNKKSAPFMDATGAHAGALLGDVLHDPFQSFHTSILNCISNNTTSSVYMHRALDKYLRNPLIKHDGAMKNYEAAFLQKNELKVLGETDNAVSPVEVLSCNRYDHEGDMIKLTTSENKELLVTPEHKIAIWKHGKIEYREAQLVTPGDLVVSSAENVIIDEQNIYATYDTRQQEQCKLFSQYLSVREDHPEWGYKRIAKAMNISISKTRWWHEQKHIPVPVQTAVWLRDRGLLPLTLDNPKLPLIAKVLGATFGDGGIFDNLNGIFLSSSEREAVEEFGKDIENIFGINESQNSRIIEGGEYGHSWCFQNTNRSIIRFFLALGAPQGNKTRIELKIPNWIKFSDKIQDDFYGSFFGGELGSPSLHKHKNRLTTLELGIAGCPEVNENRLQFLKVISAYLMNKNVNCTSIYQRQYNENMTIYRLQISKTLDNVLSFMDNIKINYCEKKKKRLQLATNLWMISKKNKYDHLVNQGMGAESAMKVLKLTPSSLFVLLNRFGPTEVSA